jgi:hypothetical protein
MDTNADLCREHGWVAGDLLCCSDTIPPELPKFVRITAIGETEVLGRRVNSDCSEGPEGPLTLRPLAWRLLSLQEWQSLQDTSPA